MNPITGMGLSTRDRIVAATQITTVAPAKKIDWNAWKRIDSVAIVRLDEQKYDADDGYVAQRRSHVVGHAGRLGPLRRVTSRRWRRIAALRWRIARLPRAVEHNLHPAAVHNLRLAAARNLHLVAARNLHLAAVHNRHLAEVHNRLPRRWRRVPSLGRSCSRWTRRSRGPALPAKLPHYFGPAIGAECHVDFLSYEPLSPPSYPIPLGRVSATRMGRTRILLRNSAGWLWGQGNGGKTARKRAREGSQLPAGGSPRFTVTGKIWLNGSATMRIWNGGLDSSLVRVY